MNFLQMFDCTQNFVDNNNALVYNSYKDSNVFLLKSSKLIGTFFLSFIYSIIQDFYIFIDNADRFSLEEIFSFYTFRFILYIE